MIAQGLHHVVQVLTFHLEGQLIVSDHDLGHRRAERVTERTGERVDRLVEPAP